jgi:outer membrane protein assembly factor BamE (lipoprotein component of BamABCDE complex)
MRYTAFFVCVTLFALLTGCGTIQSSRVPDQINAMVGLSKEQVLSCMGPPSNKASEGSTEVWTYSNFGAVTTNAFVSGNRYGALGSSSTSQDSCIVNLTMRNDAVSTANYRSQGKLLAPSLPCYSVLQVCTAGRIGSAPISASAPGRSVTDRTKEAIAFCNESYKDSRLDPIRAVIALSSAPTLSQQSNSDFISDEQLSALDSYKELLDVCRSRLAAANPQRWKIVMQVQPSPHENLMLLFEKKITIGQFNT